METTAAGTPDGTADGSAPSEADNHKWSWPARLLVAVAMMPVCAAAILAAENSLNFIVSWFSPVMIALMIAFVIGVWAATARSQR
jgi:K+ transporter